MPSKNKNKKQYLKYTSENLTKALNAVAKGSSIRSGSNQFKVPFSTIRCKRNGKYEIGKKSGPSTVLTADEEEKLVEWILAIGKKGFPLTKSMLLDSVKMLIAQLGRENPFTDGRPGRHWFEGFMRRHSQLSLRTPQNLCKRRADLTEEKLRGWYKEIEDYLKSKNLLDIDSSRIFNCDESAFFLNPKENEVIVHKKSKVVHKLIGANDKECLTVLLTGNAAGQMPPPMLMFAYKRIPFNVTKNVPSGWSIGKSDNGWMTGESFYEYMANIFHPWCVANNIDFPVIMYLDGHSSHATLALSNFCVKNQIELISLYPNSTHMTQPMDVSFFGPMKNAWKKAVLNWRVENNGEALQKSNFGTVIEAALNLMDVKKCLINGFTCCGLSPFSADALDYTKLLGNNSQKNQQNSNTDQPVLQNSDYYKNIVQSIESHVDEYTVQLFKQAENRNGIWHGEEKFRELFSFWLKCHRLFKSVNSTKINDDQAEVYPKPQTLSSPERSDIILSSNNTRVDNDVLLDGFDETANPDLNNNVDINNLDVIILENCISDKDMSVEDVSFVQKMSNTVSVLQDCNNNMSFNNIIQDKSQSDQIKEVLRNNENIYDNEFIPLEFRKALFWPTDNLLTPKKAVKRKKEKIPSVATSETWRKYHENKVAQKKQEEEEKIERKRIKLEKSREKKMKKKLNARKQRIERP